MDACVFCTKEKFEEIERIANPEPLDMEGEPAPFKTTEWNGMPVFYVDDLNKLLESIG